MAGIVGVWRLAHIGHKVRHKLVELQRQRAAEHPSLKVALVAAAFGQLVQLLEEAAGEVLKAYTISDGAPEDRSLIKALLGL